MIDPRARLPLVVKVSFVWYAVTLVPLLALLAAVALGYLHYMFGMVAIFLFFFWLFSLGFAIYAALRKPARRANSGSGR